MKPTTGIGYIRWSTSHQNDGTTEAVQRQAIEEVARREGITLRQIYVDGATSGGTAIDDREALVAALDDLRRGEAMIVYRWERLARDMYVMAGARLRIGAARAMLLSASEGWDDCDDDSDDSLEGLGRWMFRNILYMQAEWERRQAKIRTRHAMKSLKRQNRKRGRIPYGFREVPIGQQHTDGRQIYRLEQAPEEQVILDRIVSQRQAGHGWQAIADGLNADGLRDRRGNPWVKGMIHAIYTRLARDNKEAADAVAAPTT